MKSNKDNASKGFFLLYELLCFGLCSVLLAAAAQGFTACFQVQRRSLALEEAWQAAQLTAGELDVGSTYLTEVEYKEQNGYRYMEVRVYAPNRERQLCSLLKCAP